MLTRLWQWLSNGGFDLVAGSASILGFFLTVWVWFRLGRIESGFIRQAMLPVYLKKLGGSIKNLRQYHKRKNTDRILSALAVCRGTLEDVVVHLEDERATDVRQVIAAIAGVSPECALDSCPSLIADLDRVQEKVGNYIEELHLRGRHA